jgi:hypothetical protein
LLLMVRGFLYTVVGPRIRMNVSKTSSKKPDIRRPVSLLPSLSDSVNTNGVVERGDKMMAG